MSTSTRVSQIGRPQASLSGSYCALMPLLQHSFMSRAPADATVPGSPLLVYLSADLDRPRTFSRLRHPSFKSALTHLVALAIHHDLLHSNAVSIVACAANSCLQTVVTGSLSPTEQPQAQ